MGPWVLCSRLSCPALSFGIKNCRSKEQLIQEGEAAGCLKPFKKNKKKQKTNCTNNLSDFLLALSVKLSMLSVELELSFFKFIFQDISLIFIQFLVLLL